MNVHLFFVDGIGIGQPSIENPLFTTENVEPFEFAVKNPKEIFAGGVMVKTDARLGVEGRPQSASGQTTILTGINAPQLLGAHKTGFPNQTLREVIAEHSIFRQLEKRKITPNVFINAYSPPFFDTPPRWKSATTCAVEAAPSMRFQTIADIRAERAVYHDLTNTMLIEKGFDVPLWTAKKAGEVIADIASRHRFSLFEYFITDKIGHAQDFELAQVYLPQLAECLRTIIANVDLEKTAVILTSDHGNIEDLSIKNHTLNDVPTIIWGAKKNAIAEKINSLADITPTIIEALADEI